jgi:hypothetical protein
MDKSCANHNLNLDETFKRRNERIRGSRSQVEAAATRLGEHAQIYPTFENAREALVTREISLDPEQFLEIFWYEGERSKTTSRASPKPRPNLQPCQKPLPKEAMPLDRVPTPKMPPLKRKPRTASSR